MQPDIIDLNLGQSSIKFSCMKPLYNSRLHDNQFINKISRNYTAKLVIQKQISINLNGKVDIRLSRHLFDNNIHSCKATLQINP